jgi:hypothetical protein
MGAHSHGRTLPTISSSHCCFFLIQHRVGENSVTGSSNQGAPSCALSSQALAERDVNSLQTPYLWYASFVAGRQVQQVGTRALLLAGRCSRSGWATGSATRTVQPDYTRICRKGIYNAMNQASPNFCALSTIPVIEWIACLCSKVRFGRPAPSGAKNTISRMYSGQPFIN